MKYPYTENLTSKALRQFQEGDTIYITKTVNGFSYMYFCKFKRLDNGVVVAEVVDRLRDAGGLSAGTELRARSSACSLYGKDEQGRQFFHWFKNLDESAV